MKSTFKILAGPLALIALYGCYGIGWGLPSAKRTALFLSPALQTPEFFQKVAKARDDLYAKMGGNHVAYFGRLGKIGQANTLPTILNSYSSFLVKTHSLDESATLVMISHLNPLKNQWYPYAFAYGGAYLFPLAAYLGGAHVFHFIKLIGSSVYYYTHPADMARIYLAVRLWSVLGFLAACIAVFYLSRSLVPSSAAVWAMLFFGLAPTCIAHTKFAKPHTWAAALSLWAIHYALKTRTDPSPRRATVVAAAFLGLALGMTVTQIVYLPFLVWAVWSGKRQETVQRLLLVCGVIGATFLATNFYVITHFQDYLDEKFFLTQFAPFRPSVNALWQFVASVLRISLGWELWVLSMVGLGWALIQKRSREVRHLFALWVLILVYAAFQTQSSNGIPITSRLFLGLIGLLCMSASAVTFSWGRLGMVCRWGCLAVLLIKGGIFNAHCQADRAPHDNASKASIWIRDHIPAGSVIGQPLGVPQVDCFPPIDFMAYRIVSFGSREFTSARGPLYAVISPENPRWPPVLAAANFKLIKRFSESPLQKLGFLDPFTLANFSVDIYARDVSGKP